jgi:CheY-like chemotaxis protein
MTAPNEPPESAEPTPLTGAQHRIRAGDYEAAVTELGAGLRQLSHRGRPLITGYEPDELPPAGAGQLLIPWPNRIDGGRYEFGGATLPVFWLGALLQMGGQVLDTQARMRAVVVVRSAQQRIAVHVDEVLGNQEVVVKNLGPQLSRLAGIAGATVLGNGQVVLILNPVQLVHREMAAGHIQISIGVPESPLVVDQRSGSALVMVVDDSLTVRKITSRMLTREGYEVVTAKDGVDALQQLQDVKPDCILPDVEMPTSSWCTQNRQKRKLRPGWRDAKPFER